MRWIVGSGSHGCWLGSYEYEQRLLFEQRVRRAEVVFDIGAHVGFYTLLASVLVGRAGKVFAFEPVPENLSYLRQHLSINEVDNVEVLEAAVLDRPGSVQMEAGTGSSTWHLGGDSELEVTAVRLDDLIAQRRVPVPNVMKIDIEGAELLALEGARALLSEYHPTLFLSTHGRIEHEECCTLLDSLRYRLKPIVGPSLEENRDILAEARDVTQE